MNRVVEAVADVPDVPADELQFHFLAGRPCLDLVATIGERWRRAFERLRDPDDLARWAFEAGFVAAAPKVRGADLDVARRLRTAIARLVFAWVDGELLEPGDLAVVNELAARPDLPPILQPSGDLSPPVEGRIDAVLATVARDAVRLIAADDPRRIRECAADDCSLLFLDSSRPGSRRWCSMAGCGNRAKTFRHRNRLAVSR